MLVRFEIPPLSSPLEFSGKFILLFGNPRKGNDPSPRDRPTWIVSHRPSSRPDDPVRNDKLVAWCANVHLGVVQNQVFQMDKFAGHPHVGDGLEEISPLCKAMSDLRSGNTLIKPCECIFSRRYRLQESLEAQLSNFIRHCFSCLTHLCGSYHEFNFRHRLPRKLAFADMQSEAF